MNNNELAKALLCEATELLTEANARQVYEKKIRQKTR